MESLKSVVFKWTLVDVINVNLSPIHSVSSVVQTATTICFIDSTNNLLKLLLLLQSFNFMIVP